MRVLYAQPSYGDREKQAVLDALNNPEALVNGGYSKEFEAEVAALFGKAQGLLVNSGSSANELAVEALGLPDGSEVITPALSFSTTVAPIVRNGLVPVFADVNLNTFVIDEEQIEALIGPETRALMIPHLIGNVADIEKLAGIADKHDLILIEDSADTLGATFDGKPTGVYSDISTTSFYATHLITAGGIGGMVCVSNPEFESRIRLNRSWGRASALVGESERVEDRFNVQLDDMTYDRKFVFAGMGHNMQASEMEAAFGLIQLSRLNEFRQTRISNFSALLDFFEAYEEWFHLPKQDERVETAWLAFPLVVKEQAPFTRQQLQHFFEEFEIQTRTILAGNILRQPGFRTIVHRVSERGLRNSDKIMNNGLMIGCHQAIGELELAYIFETFEKFAAVYGTLRHAN